MRRNSRGVTLLELLIVMTLIALMAGISYPSAAAGIESLRLRNTADQISNFLNASVGYAQRTQQVVEVWISPKENVLIARSPDLAFARRFEMGPSFHISGVYPIAPVSPDEPRRFLMYPGGTIPAMGVEFANVNGVKRLVQMDPMSGLPRVSSGMNASDAHVGKALN